MKTKVNDNQSLADIAVQNSGSVESSFAIAVNNDISATGALEIGKVLSGSRVIDNQVVSQMDVQSIIPATASGKLANVQLSGIGFMDVEDNFIVG